MENTMQDESTTSVYNEDIILVIMGLVEDYHEYGHTSYKDAIENKLRKLVENKFSVQELEAENAHLKDAAWTAIDALEASQAQRMQQLDLSDAGLAAIYKQANNEVGKARPLTTESILGQCVLLQHYPPT